jgi:RNA polymerase sigma factor (sigma-70 family)
MRLGVLGFEQVRIKMSANPDLLRPEMLQSDRGLPADDNGLLLRYVLEDSQAAFAEIVARHHALVHSTCRRALRNPDLADDATQTVFLTLARKAHLLATDIRLPGWLYRTARHVSSDLRRQEKRRRKRHDRAVESAIAQDRAAVQPDENLRLTIAEILNRLPAPERHAISLRYFEGLTFAEVAGALGLSREGAKKRVKRALDRVRDQWADRKWLLPLLVPVLSLMRKASTAKAMLARSAKALGTSASGLSRLTAIRLATSSAVVAVAVISSTQIPSSAPNATPSEQPSYTFIPDAIPTARIAELSHAPYLALPLRRGTLPSSPRVATASVEILPVINSGSRSTVLPIYSARPAVASAGLARSTRIDPPAVPAPKAVARTQPFSMIVSEASARSAPASAPAAIAASNSTAVSATANASAGNLNVPLSICAQAEAFALANEEGTETLTAISGFGGSFDPGMPRRFWDSHPDGGGDGRFRGDSDAEGHGFAVGYLVATAGSQAIAYVQPGHAAGGFGRFAVLAGNYSTNVFAPPNFAASNAPGAGSFSNIPATTVTAIPNTPSAGGGDITIASAGNADVLPPTLAPVSSIAVTTSGSIAGVAPPSAMIQSQIASIPPPANPILAALTAAPMRPNLPSIVVASPDFLSAGVAPGDFSSPMFSLASADVGFDSPLFAVIAVPDYSVAVADFAIVQAVPEPATTGSIILIAGLFLLKRSRRKAIA